VAAWRAGGAGIGLLVALSARQVGAAGFTDTVLGAARSAGLDPGAITLEVTERVLVDCGGPIVRELSGIRSQGVRLAITGFGTGYASLSQLPQLAADVIKIDPSFMAGLGTDPAMTLLTRTVVQIGHDLGVDVIADGIERPEQAALLRQMGCELGQGPAVGGPVQGEHVEAMLAQRGAFGGGSLEQAGAAACSPAS
jgi:EAL domain-containing protein (putative c-di-GMP-specific phosphodiesterase class I)